MNISLKVRVKTRICDVATGKVVRERPWKNNLVLDSGLNALAAGTSGAVAFFNCIVGGGTNPTSTASGAITFTQSGTTVTASAGFFTSGMVGTIFKYGTGTGGAEYYITAFTDNQHVTVDTSATVSTPTVATIWFVNQTALQTFLYAATSYQTTGSSCGTVISGSQATHQRTFIVPQKGSPYSVNEIGWNSNSIGTTTNTVSGRIVLGSSDVVGTSNFYVVVLQLIFTYTPSVPTAVTNVGTNINTAGNLMTENIDIESVTSSGGNTVGGSLGANGVTVACLVSTATYSQNSVPGSKIAWGGTTLNLANANWAAGVGRGVATLTFNFSISTSGQTLYGVGVTSGGTNMSFDVLFTTPQTAPTGTFAGSFVWQFVYGRTLSN